MWKKRVLKTVCALMAGFMFCSFTPLLAEEPEDETLLTVTEEDSAETQAGETADTTKAEIPESAEEDDVSSDSAEPDEADAEIEDSPEDPSEEADVPEALEKAPDETVGEETPHEHDGVTFVPWESTDDLPTEPGSYYLTDDVTLNDSWQAPGTVNLCLNGHKVDLGDTTAWIAINPEITLNLYDESGNEGRITGGVNIGTIIISEGGTLNMYGGSLTGKPAKDFSLISVFDNGTFHMYGGSITDNNTVGVAVSTGGTFYVSGSVVIDGNISSDRGEMNVLLFKGGKINVEGELTEDALIGVSLNDKAQDIIEITCDKPYEFTSGLSGNGGLGNFTIDKDSYLLRLNDNGEEEAYIEHTFEPTYTWADDNETVTALGICSICNTTLIETVDVTGEVTKQPACVEKGETTYTAKFTNSEFKTQTKTLKDIPAIGHEWSGASYTWSGNLVVAKGVCTRDENHILTEVTNAKGVSTPASCETGGSVTLTAAFTNDLFTSQTETLENKKPVDTAGTGTAYVLTDTVTPGKNYLIVGQQTAVQYVSFGGLFRATSSAVSQKSVDLLAGKVNGADVLLAEFDPQFAPDVWTAEEGNGGIRFQNEKYYLKQEGNQLKPKYGSGSDWIVGDNSIYTTDGDTSYYMEYGSNWGTLSTSGANVFLFEEVTNVSVVSTTYEDCPALGHDWGEPTYEWADDNSTCTAAHVCKRDSRHVETETVNTTSEETKPATCIEKGETTHTAEFENEAFETQTKTEETPIVPHTLTAHPAKAATYEKAGNTAYWSCSVCGKYFSDAGGTIEIEKDSWVIPALVPVTGVKLNKTSLTLEKGKTAALTATVSPTDASNKKVTWTSNNTKVATVDASGKVTAKGAGIAKITVTTENGNKKATCNVTVTVPVTGVKLNKTSLTLEKGKTAALTATVTPSDATNKNVTWTSSNTKVATVDANGKVTAKAAGTAAIKVTTADGKKTATCKVTVKEDKDPAACKVNGFCPYKGKDYWYENGVRQGTTSDPKGVIGDGTNRGREIYDPETNAWYWLDSVYDGAKAEGKEVWMPYIYQDEANWKNDTAKMNEVVRAINAYSENGGPTSDMGEQVRKAILNQTGKWVRYDGDGKMMKGWVTIKDELAKIYPDQAGNTYFYDYTTGLMAKGWTTIGGTRYYFDEITGVLR